MSGLQEAEQKLKEESTQAQSESTVISTVVASGSSRPSPKDTERPSASSARQARKPNPERKRKHKEIELRRRTRMRSHYDELNRLSAPAVAMGSSPSLPSSRAPRTPSGMREKDDILVNAINRIKELESKVAHYEKIIASGGHAAGESSSLGATPARTLALGLSAFHHSGEAPAARPSSTSAAVTSYPYASFPHFPSQAFAPNPPSPAYFSPSFYASASPFLPTSQHGLAPTFGAPTPMHIASATNVMMADRAAMFSANFHDIQRAAAVGFVLPSPTIPTGSRSTQQSSSHGVQRSSSSPFSSLPKPNPNA